MAVRGWNVGLVLSAVLASQAWAAETSDSPVQAVADVHTASYDQAIDIRDENQCARASLPRAHCLPITFFKRDDGKSFTGLTGTLGFDGGI